MSIFNRKKNTIGKDVIYVENNLDDENTNKFSHITFDDALATLDRITYSDAYVLPKSYIVRLLSGLYELYRDTFIPNGFHSLAYYSAKILGNELYTVREFRFIIHELRINYAFASKHNDNPFDTARDLLSDYYTYLVPKSISDSIIDNLTAIYPSRPSIFSTGKMKLSSVNKIVSNTPYSTNLACNTVDDVRKVINSLEERNKIAMNNFDSVPTAKELRNKSSHSNISWAVDAENQLLEFFNNEVDSNDVLFGKVVLSSRKYRKAYDLLSLYSEYLTDKGYKVTKSSRDITVGNICHGMYEATEDIFIITWDGNKKLVKDVLTSGNQ